MQPPFDLHKHFGVRIDPSSGVVDIRDEPIYRGQEPHISPVGRNGVHAQLASPYGELSQPNVLPYFALPESYHGNQLKSYGGYLKYKLRYQGYGRPLTGPDVILTVSCTELTFAGLFTNKNFYLRLPINILQKLSAFCHLKNIQKN